MQDRPVPDGDAVADHERILGSFVQYCPILNIRILSYCNRSFVPAEYGAVPYARTLSNCDIACEDSIFRDPDGLVFFDHDLLLSLHVRLQQ